MQFKDRRDGIGGHVVDQLRAADLDEPAGFIDRIIGGDVSGIDFDTAIAEFEKSDPPRAGRPD